MHTMWAAGFVAGSVLAAMGVADADPQARELVQAMHDGIARGIADARTASSPSSSEAYKAISGKL